MLILHVRLCFYGKGGLWCTLQCKTIFLAWPLRFCFYISRGKKWFTACINTAFGFRVTNRLSPKVKLRTSVGHSPLLFTEDSLHCKHGENHSSAQSVSPTCYYTNNKAHFSAWLHPWTWVVSEHRSDIMYTFCSRSKLWKASVMYQCTVASLTAKAFAAMCST